MLTLAFAVLALPGRGQVFNMDRDRVPMAPLNGLMRFHTGDDPDGKLGWSDSAFDDSSWPLISSARSWSEQGYKDYGGFAWYRFSVILPREHRQLALYVPSIRTSYQVFADGKLVGSFGGFPPDATVYNLHHHVVPLPQEHSGRIEIAIRVWHWPGWATSTGGGMTDAPRIGDADTLNNWEALQDRSTFWELSAGNCTALLCLLYCVAGFALYLMRRKEPVYLWYGLLGFFFFVSPLVLDYGAFHDVPLVAAASLRNVLAAGGFFCFVMFTWMLLGARRTIWVWAAGASLLLHIAMSVLPFARHLPGTVADLLFVVIDLPTAIGPLVMLIQGVRRGNPDARLLLIPVALNTLANWISDVLTIGISAGHPSMKPSLAFWTQTFRWPFPFGLYDLSVWMIVLAVLGIVVLRFARSRHEEEQLNSEFEAARTVQQLLIPEAAPRVPGFRIESAYKPARYVGGDFFYIRPEEGNGILLVIGDVSGKGLKAALAVNLVIGALRTMPTMPLPRILAALNRGLIGQMQGGFVTCCAARIDRDGIATFANAGHLAPYIDGREMELPAAFPLGIAAEGPFEESTLKLTPGARLTLITDGVVEARNASGELFGFDRTAAISTNAAEDIAGAAQHFGQEDDITVLTLTFAPG